MNNSLSDAEYKRRVEQRVNKFKHEIGIGAFQFAENSLPLDKGIILPAPRNMLEILPLVKQDWYQKKDTIYLGKGGWMEQKWVLDRDDDTQLSISINVATNVPAKNLIFDLAAIGMLATMPDAFKLGPADLGNLSIISNTPNPDDVDTVFWVNHNIIIKMFSVATDIDLMSIAYALDRYLNQHVVKSPYEKAPKFSDIEIAPDKIFVSQPFWTKLHPEAELEAEYIMGPELEDTHDGTFDIQGQDSLAIKLKITKPGDFEIPMWVGDKRTLLSSCVVAHVKVLPDDEPNK